VIEPRIGYLLGIGWLALAGSVVTFPLYFGLIQRMGAGRAAYTSVLIPVIAMLISTLAEGYRWSGLAVPGALLAIAGMVIALRAKTRA
jgi:drug/metabolite transporter (DMT)-like permease